MTKEEKTWIENMQRLLNKTPQRFGFYTTGDCSLSIYDKGKEPLFNQDRDLVYDVYEHEADIGCLNFTTPVHGVLG